MLLSHGAGLKGTRIALRVVPLALLAVSGCIVDSSPPPPPPDTEIGFDEVQNFGVGCGPLTGWTVTGRELQQTLYGGCGDQLVFEGLAPNASYTFDLAAYEGQTLCWQGSCSVPTEDGVLTWGDCSSQIQSLCR